MKKKLIIVLTSLFAITGIVGTIYVCFTKGGFFVDNEEDYTKKYSEILEVMLGDWEIIREEEYRNKEGMSDETFQEWKIKYKTTKKQEKIIFINNSSGFQKVLEAVYSDRAREEIKDLLPGGAHMYAKNAHIRDSHSDEKETDNFFDTFIDKYGDIYDFRDFDINNSSEKSPLYFVINLELDKNKDTNEFEIEKEANALIDSIMLKYPKMNAIFKKGNEKSEGEYTYFIRGEKVLMGSENEFAERIREITPDFNL